MCQLEDNKLARIATGRHWYVKVTDGVEVKKAKTYISSAAAGTTVCLKFYGVHIMRTSYFLHLCKNKQFLHPVSPGLALDEEIEK